MKHDEDPPDGYPPGIGVVAATWSDLILVCGKCTRKLHGGFGPDREDSLARSLKHAARAADCRQRVRVIETRCLGLCPNRAVTVVPATRPGVLLAVPRGVDADALLRHLLNAAVPIAEFTASKV